VLQHEQIHFPLFEIEARRLDRKAKTLAREEVFEGDSVDEVKADIQSIIQDLFDETTETLLDRNRDFDEVTSLGYEPARQKEWFDTVTKELSER
jgi:dGTP triphosphohydrolase